MRYHRSFSDPSQPNLVDTQNQPHQLNGDSASDDDELPPTHPNRTDPSRRDRANSASSNPRKRRMSFLQRAATRLRGDRTHEPVSGSSTAVSSGHTPLAPHQAPIINLDPMPVPEEQSEYPQWLRKILHEHNGTSVAIAYQLSSPDADCQHATFTPLRCSYPGSENQQQTAFSKYGDFGYNMRNVGSTATLCPGPKPDQDSSQPLVPPDPTKRIREPDHEPMDVCSSATSCCARLDTSKIPVEIWDQIMQSLSRDDIKNLRLVDKAIERSISGRLFKTVVVPFTTDIYGALADSTLLDSDTPLARDKNWFSKGRGLDIFRGFGRHIRNFGMSFEIDNASLTDPPTKVLQQGHESYWGTYSWPFPQYARFKDRADLEVTADETSTMKLAFSHLNGVKHLALSLDSGLGWLGGPDKSVQARILERPNTIFGSSFHEDADILAQRELLSLVEESYNQAARSSIMFAELVRNDTVEASKLQHITGNWPSIQARARIASAAGLSVDASESTKSRSRLNNGPPLGSPQLLEGGELSAEDIGYLVPPYGFRLVGPPRRRRCTSASHDETSYGAGDDYSASAEAEETPNRMSKTPVPQTGLLLIKPVTSEHESRKTTIPPFLPGSLTKDQKEWLLESAWAQDAFLSSYLLAVADNASSFQNVSALTITRFSSRHLPKLCRDDFWASLPLLKRLDLRIIADHRDVRKTETGLVETPSARPSDAITPYYRLLSRFIAQKQSIEALSLGWSDGGEHAEGIFARNLHILPAPLTPDPLNIDETSWGSHLVHLPYIQELTLVNCWLAPNALVAFLGTGEYAPNLRRLYLESFSLTAHPKYERPARHNNGIPGFHAMMMQQLNNLNAAPIAQHQAGHAGQAGPGGIAAMLAQQFPVQQPQNMAQTLANVHPNAVANFMGHAQIVQALQNVIAQQQAQPPVQPPMHQHHFQGFAEPRDGSWPQVLKQVKDLRAEAQEERISIAFLSCGYVRLPGAPFDQSRIDEVEAAYNISHNVANSQTNFFALRKSLLAEVMMTCQDSLMGNIALGITGLERTALRTTWGLEGGWPSRKLLRKTRNGFGHDDDDDDEVWSKWGEKAKKAAEYDGARRGGKGRFSGRIGPWRK